MRRSLAARKSTVSHHSSPASTVDTLKQQVHSELFLDAIAAAASRSCERRPGTAFSTELMVVGLLHLVIERWPALRAMFTQMIDGAIAGFDPVKASEAAFYKRLENLPHGFLLELLLGMRPNHAAQRTLKRLKELAPFATAFRVIDESTLDALARKSLELRKHARAKAVVLGGRIGCLMDMATRQLIRLVFEEDADANEKTHVEALLQGMEKGTMVTFDLGYFSFGLFDRLTESGIHFVCRMRKKTSFIVLQTLVLSPVYRERIVFLGKHNSEKAAHPCRLVEIKIGGQWWSYLTNVLDPKTLRADAVWAIYCCRWSIEKVFAVIKRELGMAHIHMTSLNGMLLQLWSTLIIYQILQDLRLEIAATHGWDDDDVSWTMLRRYITMYSAKDRAGQTLVDYLKLPRKHASLKKAGVRQRRLTELPNNVLDAILQKPTATPEALPSRKPRQRTWTKKSAKRVFTVPLG